MRKFEKPKFKITDVDESSSKATFVVEPLERGYGTTLGNALRRVLLSSLPGASMYAIEVEGARHEFSSLDGVREDVTAIVLNLKDLIFFKIFIFFAIKCKPIFASFINIRNFYFT